MVWSYRPLAATGGWACSLVQAVVYLHYLPASVIRRFYLAYVRPRLEYCSAVWGGASHGVLYRLERVQLKMARLVVASVNWHLTGSDLLKAANLSTLAWRRREHRLLLLWKVVNGLGPPQISRVLPLSVSARSACSLHAPHRLQFPASSSSRHLSSFLCTTIPEWNSLPAEVADSSSPRQFVSGVRLLFESDRFSFGL